MRFGLISDVHGQPDALHRVLDILEDAGVDRVLCGGDLVDKGPDPNGVVRLVNEALVSTVLGNHDHAALLNGADSSGTPLAADVASYLRSLPSLRDYQLGLTSLWLTHAVPGCTGERFADGPLPKPVKRALRYNPPDFILFGHHHRPTCRRFKNAWLLNPGSVCRGRARDSHTCAILDLWRWKFELLDIGSCERLAVYELPGVARA